MNYLLSLLRLGELLLLRIGDLLLCENPDLRPPNLLSNAADNPLLCFLGGDISGCVGWGEEVFSVTFSNSLANLQQKWQQAFYQQTNSWNVSNKYNTKLINLK